MKEKLKAHGQDWEMLPEHAAFSLSRADIRKVLLQGGVIKLKKFKKQPEETIEIKADDQTIDLTNHIPPLTLPAENVEALCKRFQLRSLIDSPEWQFLYDNSLLS